MGGQEIAYPKGPFAAVTAFLAALVLGTTAYMATLPGSDVPAHFVVLYLIVLAPPIAIYGASTLMGSIRLEDDFIVVRFGLFLTAAVPLAAVSSVEAIDKADAGVFRMGVRMDRKRRSASVVSNYDDIVTLTLSRPIGIRAGLLPGRIERLHFSAVDPEGTVRMLREKDPSVGGNAPAKDDRAVP